MPSNAEQLLLGQRGRLEPKLKAIGDTWKDLQRVLGWATHNSFANPQGPHAYWGKEVILWGETDGYEGLKNVTELLSAKSGLTLVISGGDYGREAALDNVGSLDLLKRLLETPECNHPKVTGNIVVDSMSRHTGHQRMILGSLLSAALRPEEMWVVVSKYLMPRFLMSIGLPLYVAGLHLNVYPRPFGDWETAHATKGPLDDFSRTFTYAQLLMLPPTPSRFDGKDDCGEIDKIIEYANPDQLKRQSLTFREMRKWLKI